uniref:C2 domain-containing protein n=1 Tax=Sinocyclocheilus anshuiensis TaxID=1608454 RepID=A0A671P648_9TELE
MALTIPQVLRLATLKVYNLRAKGLYGDVGSQTDGTVTVTYETFEFGPIKIRMANKLTFKVYDADSYWNSDLLGSCSFDLRSGVVTDSCAFKYGRAHSVMNTNLLQ